MQSHYFDVLSVDLLWLCTGKCALATTDTYFIVCYRIKYMMVGQGNSSVVSVSVCQGGGPGLRPARSACHGKVRFYHCVIDSFPPVPTTG